MCRECCAIGRQERRVRKRVYKEIGAKQYEGEGPPQAPPEEGMYNLGVVGSLLLLACTRSLEGGDVQIGCWLGVYCWWLVHALWTVGMCR